MKKFFRNGDSYCSIVSGNGNVVIDGCVNGTVVVGGRVISGNGVLGNGKVKTEKQPIDLKGSAAIACDLPCDLTIRCGISSSMIEITADENLLPLIKAQVSGSQLKLTAAKSFSTSNPLQITLDIPSLSTFSQLGSGDTLIEEVDSESLTLDLIGSGDIEIVGYVTKLAVNLQGSGDIDASDLDAKTAVLQLNGSGDIKARVTDSLTARLIGSGDIKVAGSPLSIEKACLGSGDIRVR